MADEELTQTTQSKAASSGSSTVVEKDCDFMDQTCPLSPSPSPVSDNGTAVISENVNGRICAVCGACNARRCTNCKQISYCGKEHQIEHWKIHKENCFPVKVVDKLSVQGISSSSLQGRDKSHVLVATRDIKQGEVFFRENVILVSPGPWNPEALEIAKGRPICVSCCEIIKGTCDFDEDDDEDCTVRCSACRWPVCNRFCETARRHSDYECKVLASNNVSSMVLNQMPDYECILVLRALLLRENDPERWMRLLNLDSPVETCMDNEASSLFLNSCVKFIREQCNLKQYSDSLIRQVASICYVNALNNEDHPGDNGYIYKISSYIGDVSSKVAHSCVSNSEWAVIPSDEDQIRFRALVAIRADEPITMMYNFKQLCHQSTQVRQQFYNERYFFTCSCDRCNDPTELSSFMSAVKCNVEKCSGYLIPLEPNKMLSVWRCDSPSCGKVESYKGVQCVLSALNQNLELFPYKDPMRPLSKNLGDTKRAIVALKKVVDKFSGSQLHPNHHLLLEAEWKIVQDCYYYIMNVKQWTPSVVDLLIGIGKKHLAIFDKLSPGINHRRGYILYFLQSGLLESIRHGTASLTKHPKKKIKDPSSHETLKKTYTEMMAMRDETVRIFSFKGVVKNSMEEELVSFSAPDQPFISCLRFLERILDRSIEA